MQLDMNQECVRLEYASCPLGCAAFDTVVLVGRDLLHDLPGEFTVVKCETCGLMRTNPRPTPETIGFYYPEEYGPYMGTRVEVDDMSIPMVPMWKQLLKKVINFNTQSIPALSPGRMLEIGCAAGSFMHRMARDGWEVDGIEFNENAANSARMLGYPVHTGTVESAPDPSSDYDLVVGWMVMEHLHDPMRVLKKLHQWVRPKGWLVISIPNADAFEFRLFGKFWYALQLPTHLYHYTPRTIDALLLRSGWSLKKVTHHRVLTNLIVSLGYSLKGNSVFHGIGNWLEKLPNKGVMVNILLYPLAYIFAFFGQTGRITVWARRIE